MIENGREIPSSSMEEEMRIFRRFMVGLSIGMVASVVFQELQKPPEKRTWQGRVGGLVPYDFRPPTPERLRQAYWNPDEPGIFTDRVLGLGWAINFYSLLEALAAQSAKLQAAIREGT